MQISVDDFNVICRTCLQIHENMVDIVGCGIDDTLLEITNIKVTVHDKLPKMICSKCKQEIDCMTKFLEKARSSDVYLRSLLPLVDNVKREESQKEDHNLMETSNCQSVTKCEVEDSILNDDKKKGSSCKKSKKTVLRRRNMKMLPKKAKLSKGHPVGDKNKLYLIFVPELESRQEGDNGICIKDVDCTNRKLTSFCRTLLDNYTVNSKCNEVFNVNNVGDKNLLKTIEGDNGELNFTYNENSITFECAECNKAFDDHEDFTNHQLTTHNGEISHLQFYYVCPICKFEDTENLNFLTHLKEHDKEGYQFVKVNSSGNLVPLKGSGNGAILKSENTQSGIKCRVVKLNLDIFNCTVCSDKIESENSVADHIRVHQSNGNFENHFYVKYNCPVCNAVFFDCKKNFIHHLMSHKSDNVHFMKVNSAGHPLELDDGDDLFISYREAVELVKAPEESPVVFKVTNPNSCDICDHVAESFALLTAHCKANHSSKPSIFSLACPVCQIEFEICDSDETKYKLYDHLKSHKNEGVHFVEVNRNGSLSKSNDGEFLDIFTQSPLFYNLSCYSAEVGPVWFPDLFLHTSKRELLRELDDVNDGVDQSKKSDDDNSDLICETCGATCHGLRNYNKHFKKHSKPFEYVGKRQVCCKVCGKIFASKGALSSHMAHHRQGGHGDGVAVSGPNSGLKICEKCGKSYLNQKSLEKHRKIHSGTSRGTAGFKCDICGRQFFSRSSYDRHTSAHLNPRYSDCDVCKLPLSSPASLLKHSESHQTTDLTYDCKTCQVSFLTRESLKAHQIQTSHYPDREPFECNVCHERFFIGKKFTEHIKSHPKYKMGACTLCGKRLSTLQSLMLHMRRHFDSNSILCPHCGKQFFEERNYHRHLLTHEGIKPYQCNVQACTKSFYTAFELNRHKKYHSNTRDFPCSYCSKSFHEANHLTVHIRTHTGERPYTCPHCNKGFTTRTRCKSHIKLIHQGIGYDLIQSNISKKVPIFEAVSTSV